tara:strand:+ start:6809 stop:7006 length:198 start_codon:yes stop_codon:yes gene_type:complete
LLVEISEDFMNKNSDYSDIDKDKYSISPYEPIQVDMPYVVIRRIQNLRVLGELEEANSIFKEWIF